MKIKQESGIQKAIKIFKQNKQQFCRIMDIDIEQKFNRIRNTQ